MGELIGDKGFQRKLPFNTQNMPNFLHVPHINRSGVLRGTKQNIWRPIPQRDDFIRVCLRRNGFGTGETKISKLYTRKTHVIVNQRAERQDKEDRKNTSKTNKFNGLLEESIDVLHESDNRYDSSD